MKKILSVFVIAILMGQGCARLQPTEDNQQSSSATTSTTPIMSSAKEITSFSILGQTGTIGANTVAVTVPFGTNVTALVATFTISGASVNIAGTNQVSGATANNFATQLVYTVVAPDSTTKEYTVTVTVAPNTAKDITVFSIMGQTGTIGANTVAVTVPFGTNVTALVATFTISGASVNIAGTNQVSGTTANNFTTAKTYTVVAADASTKNFTVTVTVAANTAKDITAFSIMGQTGTIGANTVAVTVPFGTNVTALVATFTISGASVNIAGTNQVSGTTANNFTTAKTYTVVAADASTKNYTVTVTVAANPAKDITAFSILGQTGTIGASTVAVTVPFGTNVTALVATFTISGASVDIAGTNQVSGTTANNFTTAKTYTVIASDASTKNYTVTVTVAAASPGLALWGKSLTASAGNTAFSAVAAGTGGSIYAVGYQIGNATYSYAPGVSATGPSSSGARNAVIVKYNSNGDAVWATSLVSSDGLNDSMFSAVACDASENIYVVGYQHGTVSYSYGAGATISGTGVLPNSILVKYNSAGVAQWARTVSTGIDYNAFNGVATDTAGNIYAAGYIRSTYTYTYGTGVSISGLLGGAETVALVKYDPNGNAIWAKTATAGSASSRFNSVAVDSGGGIVAVGGQVNSGTFTYGPGVSATSPVVNSNALIVKYDNLGAAQWARTIVSGSSYTSFSAIAADTAGNVYVTGRQDGTASHSYGAAATLSGIYAGGSNGILIKYSSGGTAVWGQTATSGGNETGFSSIAVANGKIFVAGSQRGIGSYTYGSGVNISGSSIFYNIVAVKYDFAGAAEWAKSVTTGSSTSLFAGVTADPAGTIVSVGSQDNTGGFVYGTGVSITAPFSGTNSMVIKYAQ
jgi:hypothetical protein